MAWLKSIVINLRKFLQLTESERWLLLQAFLLLPFISLSLHCLGFRRLYLLLASWCPLTLHPSDDVKKDLRRAGAMVQLVDAAAQHGLHSPNCLPKSMTLWWLLKRQGIPGVLRLGVCPQGGRLAAHAWVELQGLVLNDEAEVHLRFLPFEGAIIS